MSDEWFIVRFWLFSRCACGALWVLTCDGFVIGWCAAVWLDLGHKTGKRSRSVCLSEYRAIFDSSDRIWLDI